MGVHEFHWIVSIAVVGEGLLYRLKPICHREVETITPIAATISATAARASQFMISPLFILII